MKIVAKVICAAVDWLRSTLPPLSLVLAIWADRDRDPADIERRGG